MEILETQERKMNKNKEKKRELTHFLGHYLSACLLVHIRRHVESRWQPIHCIIVSILWTIGNDETVQHRY